MSEEKLIVNKKKLQPKRLGMGLSALLGGLEDIDIFNTSLSSNHDSKLQAEDLKNGFAILSIGSIIPSESQPRKVFSQSELEELAESIKKNGVLQPILVRKIGERSFEIVAGERRYRASKLAGIETIPCIIKDLSDEEVFVIAVVENIQREDLNPLEEAESYIKLIKQFNYTQEQVGNLVGKSRSHIANITRLSNLPARVKQMVMESELTAGHTRPLLALKTEDQMIEIAQVIIQNHYSVRKVEELVNLILSDEEKLDNISENLEKIERRIQSATQTPNIVYLEAISRAFHSKFEAAINIKPSKKGGVISIKYKTEEALNLIMQNLIEDDINSSQTRRVSNSGKRDIIPFDL